MTETKVLTFRISAESLPARPGSSVALDVNVYLPETVRSIGEGWEPLSHALTPIGEDVLISILVKREVTVPDEFPTA